MRSTRNACDKVYQLLAHGRWFSPGTPASSTTKTGRHDITEILLKVALKHQKLIKSNQLFLPISSVSTTVRLNLALFLSFLAVILRDSLNLWHRGTSLTIPFSIRYSINNPIDER